MKTAGTRPSFWPETSIPDFRPSNLHLSAWTTPKPETWRHSGEWSPNSDRQSRSFLFSESLKMSQSQKHSVRWYSNDKHPGGSLRLRFLDFYFFSNFSKFGIRCSLPSLTSHLSLARISDLKSTKIAYCLNALMQTIIHYFTRVVKNVSYFVVE